MQDLQAVKTVAVTSPGPIVDDAAFTTNTVDTKGFKKARFVVMLGALDIAVAAFKLRESDDSGMSGATDVSGADFSVSPLTLPAATDDNNLFAIFVDLRGRKRYLDVSLTGGNGSTGTYAAAWCDLYDAYEMPNSAAERGMSQEAKV